MTLQIVLGGSDGILLGTDTKATGFPTRQSPLREHQRRALEFGKTRSGEYGAEKVLFNDSRTIAVMCSGSDKSVDVGKALANKLENVWNEYSDPIEKLCLAEWKRLPMKERRESVEEGESTLILINSGNPNIFRIKFDLDRLKPRVFHRSKTQRAVVFGGDSLNPAGLLLERYLPERPPSISKLALLAAHYILVGGELNPAGIGGLAMYFSKEGATFEAVGDSALEELRDRSERLNRRVQKALLQPVNF